MLLVDPGQRSGQVGDCKEGEFRIEGEKKENEGEREKVEKVEVVNWKKGDKDVRKWKTEKS